MRIKYSSLVVVSALIGITVNVTPYYAQESDNVDVYMMCSKETKHTKIYDFGKKLAEGWVYWSKTDAKDEKKYPVKTKDSFFTRAMIGYTKKYNIDKESPLYYCYMGYSSGIKESSWSSVHKGLVDYLPAQSKSKFLSLPER